MLCHLRTLVPGDWLIQNVANSAVGQCVRQIGAHLGLWVLNVVRRPDARPAAPVGHWIVDSGADPAVLQGKVAALTEGAPVRLALDAIGGEASHALSARLADGGLLPVYGLLSGQPCQVSAHELVFCGIEVRGFWLASWFADAGNRDKARTLDPELIAMLEVGKLRMDVEAVYPLAQVHDALAHAARSHRSGKVLLKGGWMDRVASAAWARCL